MKALLLSMMFGATAAGAFAQVAPEPFTAPYLDEQGEEVFGLGYIPQSPDDSGTPLLVGQPAAGAQVEPAFRPLRQTEFLGVLDSARPATDAPSGARAGLPLLKSVRDGAGAMRWSPPAARLLAPTPAARAAAVKEMTVHYVYVGQGAGAILEFPCGVAVIDTGGEYQSGDNGGQMFIDYLEAFFAARPALNRTIDVLITSHPHKDHFYGLSLMKFTGPGAFKVRNIVDNGQSGTEGSLKAQTQIRALARAAGAGYSAIELKSQKFATGVTNAVIDPLTCPGVDPKITAFWGGRNEALSIPGAARAHQYGTPNNHSVVVRVDYDKASLLFLGDLQQEGARDMLEEYQDNLEVFNVDVYLSAHHGADNGTSDPLLGVMSPRIGIISMGDRSSIKRSTAYDHGHPRLSTLKLMQEQPDIVSDVRDKVTFWGAEAEETPFKDVEITKAIYGTGWEGTLLLKVKSNGSYKVTKP